MYQMKIDAPEFIYYGLKEIPNLQFTEILLFSNYIDELFQKGKF